MASQCSNYTAVAPHIRNDVSCAVCTKNLGQAQKCKGIQWDPKSPVSCKVSSLHAGPALPVPVADRGKQVVLGHDSLNVRPVHTCCRSHKAE